MSTISLHYPFDPAELLRKKRALLRGARELPAKIEKRIAILGGSSTAELRDFLELFLRQEGIAPLFYESEYAKFYEDIVFENAALDAFRPDLIYIATTNMNLRAWPNPSESSEAAHSLRERELSRFLEIWNVIDKKYACAIVQNNFEEPLFRPLGNLDFSEARGRVRFVRELNETMAQRQEQSKSFFVNDLHYLSAWFGLERWYDRRYWHAYKYAMSMEAIPALAHQTARLIAAIFGFSRKALVLDLDNTLWGGVIGDDGLKGIQIGRETPEAEAYTEFQEYAEALYKRGVLLAVCSKNEQENAELGFTHPDSVLKREQFSAFQANWDPKDGNLRKIASSLNIGLDTLVFADDNPVERELVRSQASAVAVPELGEEISRYAILLDKAGYFETAVLSQEDVYRNRQYQENEKREEEEKRFTNYGEFLQSLQMHAEIAPFSALYLDRITQLTNKTNQFNLTTRRYTAAELQVAMNSKNYITLYGRLTDRFGEHGLISLLLAEIQGTDAILDLWLMSCRVLKRGMEQAMMDSLVDQALQHGVQRLVGVYLPTAKNAMVKDFYAELGFRLVSESSEGKREWEYLIHAPYVKQNKFIEVRA